MSDDWYIIVVIILFALALIYVSSALYYYRQFSQCSRSPQFWCYNDWVCKEADGVTPYNPVPGYIAAGNKCGSTPVNKGTECINNLNTQNVGKSNDPKAPQCIAGCAGNGNVQQNHPGNDSCTNTPSQCGAYQTPGITFA